MKVGIDTNILVRAIHSDPKAVEQCQLARDLVRNTIEKGGVIYINNIVLCEMLWVLSFSYKLPKSALVEILETITSTSCYQLHNAARVKKALNTFKKSSADFPDLLIAELNKSAGCNVTYTFDRKASKLDHYSLLKE